MTFVKKRSASSSSRCRMCQKPTQTFFNVLVVTVLLNNIDSFCLTCTLRGKVNVVSKWLFFRLLCHCSSIIIRSMWAYVGDKLTSELDLHMTLTYRWHWTTYDFDLYIWFWPSDDLDTILLIICSSCYGQRSLTRLNDSYHVDTLTDLEFLGRLSVIA